LKPDFDRHAAKSGRELKRPWAPNRRAWGRKRRHVKAGRGWHPRA
jgi:hypothetical protein